MYQDVQSGPATGGEGGNGIYLNIYGLNFGTSQGSSTVTVNGTPVAQYIYWGADRTGDRQQIGIQIASGTTGAGQIVVTTPGGSCSNLSFTVRSGHIWFIGPSVDTSTPGNCSTLEAANSYSTPWGLTNYASTNESDYNASTMRTPYTYYACISPGDTLVFLNGVNYPYFDGRGWHAALTPDKPGTTSTSFVTIMARPGATATIGGEGGAAVGIRNTGASTYTVYSGLTLIGSGGNSGSGLIPNNYDRFVGNTFMCPSCDGQSAAVTGVMGNVALGNLVTNVSNDTTVLPNGSDKEYHAAYFEGDNLEFGWNRIYNTAAYNGFQINQDGSTGFYNFSVHDNDIADVNGSGINLSDIDPSSGYVQVYNNIIHHTGVSVSSDGGGGDPHSCIAVKGYGSSTGVGTAEIYNNSMFDCSSYLNSENSSADCAILIYNNQTNVTTNLVNNVVYQPAYTNSSSQDVYICGGGAVGTLSGSNNIWYSAATPGSTAYATAVGTIEDPLYVNPADGAWTNYELQSSSPAGGGGISVGPVDLAGLSNTYLTWDFTKVLRPSPPSIGALESVGTSSGDVITIDVSPNPANLGQSVTLTSTVGQTAGSLPTGTINFMNGSVSLGQASLDSAGTATLTLSTLSAGSYAIVGSYSGDPHYPAGQSAVAPLQVVSTTATTLVASPNPVTAGQTLNLVATVSASGTASLSGTVNFMNGSTVLGSGSVNSSGVATLSISSLPAGTYSLTARFVGNSSFGSSTSAAASVTVNASAATTTATNLIASPNPVSAGQPLNLVATVSASGTASFSGTVNFMNGSTMLGSATVGSSGVATLSTASLPAGTYSLTAHYQGTTSLGASTSAVASVIVNSSAAKTTATSLVASPNPVSAGQTLNLVATVSASGTASFSGTVNFMNGSTVLGSGSVSSSGVATLSTASLPAGTYSLTAHYQGTTSLGASTSAAASVTVNASTSTTSIALSATPNPVTEGQALILTATVTENGTAVSTGAVSFMNGSSVLGTAALNSSGVATLSITSLAVGTYSLTAQYPSAIGNSPQGSGSASPASATVLVTVDAATAPIVPSFSMTVSGSTPSVLAGGTAVYSLAVTPTTGTTLPAITFAASGLPIGATATFSPAMIAAGRGTTNVTLSIQTSAAQSARLERTRELNGGLPVVALCLLLLPFGRSSRRFGKRLMRLSSLALLLAGAASLMGLTGCGADVARSTVQSYTVTVTSASASVTQTAQVTLAVE
jgi:Bacterial Ig-like domain (group 3)